MLECTFYIIHIDSTPDLMRLAITWCILDISSTFVPHTCAAHRHTPTSIAQAPVAASTFSFVESSRGNAPGDRQNRRSKNKG
jgi:hypothetical protein